MLNQTNAAKAAGLREAFKNREFAEKFRAWAGSADTAAFLSYAAELVLPSPSTDAVRASQSETLAYLVRKETVEDFILACQKLENYATLDDGNGLPESDYGAPRPEEKKKPAAKPARA